MFIEPRPLRYLLAPEERNGSPTRVPLPEHCAPLERRLALVTGFYKHLAPLEPETLFSCGVSSAV